MWEWNPIPVSELFLRNRISKQLLNKTVLELKAVVKALCCGVTNRGLRINQVATEKILRSRFMYRSPTQNRNMGCAHWFVGCVIGLSMEEV
ncbi:hypothetical protein OSTOST_03429 [Ostertagia ostertagi]